MSNDNSDDATKFRVEDAEGVFQGFSGSQSGAEKMAEECERIGNSESPHQVRKVPEEQVHSNGTGAHPIVYTTEEGEEAGSA